MISRFVALLLLSLSLISALLLVHTHNEKRNYFIELQKLQSEAVELERDLSKMQVDISNLTQIEDIRRKALKQRLHSPQGDEVKIIRMNYVHKQ